MDWNLGTAARTLWQEARGEPLEGQRAVAHVIVNRLKDGRWGHSLDEVCRSEFHGVHQFSGWNRSDPNRVAASRLSEADSELLALGAFVQAALDGEDDPTEGATHYYARSIPAPDWIKDAIFCGRFGRQLFYRGVK
jgi:N-acetylmuramoyl-L-alanine amidase